VHSFCVKTELTYLLILLKRYLRVSSDLQVYSIREGSSILYVGQLDIWDVDLAGCDGNHDGCRSRK
jgi:hypothetical protein